MLEERLYCCAHSSQAALEPSIREAAACKRFKPVRECMTFKLAWKLACACRYLLYVSRYSCVCMQAGLLAAL